MENICNTRKNGLSPLARGTLTEPRPYVMQIRFIPAGAGNTRRRRSGWPSPAVYPRWRGEHFQRLQHSHRQRGLSPLARGTHFDLHLIRPPGRFIPAGAGNTTVTKSVSGRVSVYPRWRGEHGIINEVK